MEMAAIADRFREPLLLRIRTYEDARGRALTTGLSWTWDFRRAEEELAVCLRLLRLDSIRSDGIEYRHVSGTIRRAEPGQELTWRHLDLNLTMAVEQTS